MEAWNRILEVFLLFGFIFLWNRFVVKYMIKSVGNFHKKNNSKNLNKQPIKFFIDNEDSIHKVFSAFYWFGGIVIAYGILFDY